ncbi:MAG: DUF1028 domain-containing protein [Planctomycetota bacterium]
MRIYPAKTRLPILALLLSWLFFGAFASSALATWSIVVVNNETGEVGAGSATCIANMNLKKGVGVIVVGKGAAQAQAMIDQSGENRLTIANALQSGMTAQMILDELVATDPELQKHQYGIAVLQGGMATFTGTNTMAYTSGLTGEIGPIRYSIQGNVLTGEEVLLAAETALVSTEGDLGQKVMAAMHAAKYYGGDGRCSCMGWAPTACGSPPVKNKDKDKHWKSAHISYLVIARIGDTDGEFTQPLGFANGSYYMDLNISATNPTDTVDLLQAEYDAFRGSWAGHADHLLSQKQIIPRVIQADGSSKAELLIALADINNQALPASLDRTIIVSHADNSAGATTIGHVEDLGHGVYSIMLTATHNTGVDLFRIEVEDGKGPVTLYPFPKLNVVAPPKVKRLK